MTRGNQRELARQKNQKNQKKQALQGKAKDKDGVSYAKQKEINAAIMREKQAKAQAKAEGDQPKK
ncbi:hypothetical protein H4R18_002310 [Coemansia javaensis]|uniref:Small EDRK-rich factor-like N-terminal domain-containing protein n=1 Tax=Coemansia javaensis TaxID=2761396 RepID=A0A9W8HH39_9FUNG|nr:hypothetical protein H4R18_002310 [Coemansia javaensis]